jgi:hypothetical protein
MDAARSAEGEQHGVAAERADELETAGGILWIRGGKRDDRKACEADR